MKWTSLASVVIFQLVAGSALATPIQWAVSDGGNGHCYEVVVESRPTWDEGRSRALAGGGYLVTISSAEEQRFVEDLLIASLAPTGGYWLGLVETATEGVYTWDNGEALVYTHWLPREPNNALGGESCGQMLWRNPPNPSRHGFWNDSRCGRFEEIQLDLVPSGYISEHTAACGDGVLNVCEECDDGNTIGDDGCDAKCRIEAGLRQCLADLAAATADIDQDGRGDFDDTCPGTVPGADVDQGGCSLEQFCSAFDATTKLGRRLCKKADWKNDEPLMKRREADCSIDKGEQGRDDDRCVPTLD